MVGMKKKNALNSMILEFTMDRKNNIYRLLQSYDNIYVYGMGEASICAVNFLKGIQISIDGMIVEKVDDSVPGFSSEFDIPICSQDNMSTANSICVVADSIYQDEIVKSLVDRNTPNIAKLSEGGRGNYNTLVDRNRPKIEITTKLGCDIQCKFCPQQVLYQTYFKEDKRRKTYMDMEIFEQCISHIPKNSIVTFAGFSEPFLNKDCVDMILMAHERGFGIELFTTFVGVTEDDLYKIKDVPFELITFHIPDEMGYSKIDMTEEYIKVVDRILDLNKADGTSFIDLANCQSIPSKKFMEIANRRLYVKLDTLCDRAGNLTEGEFIKVDRRFGQIVCAASRNMDHFVVLPDGEVVLCNMDFGMQYDIGNLSFMTYDDIINSDSYMRILEQMKTEDSNLICRNCFLSHKIDQV